ncbi:MAG: hypothetical protein KF716_24480 [Anaerolineae bacterium]|nr:hypothetical protein [Anaerolineae bacterium]
MAQTATSWRTGKSGNPNGRPPMRTRPLATALREIGAESVAERENRTAVASLVWRALRTGKLELDSGTQLQLTAKEWLDLLKWVHQHVDGGLNRKDQYTEARDQQSQLEELFADLDLSPDDDETAPDPAPTPTTVPAPAPTPEPLLHTQS